MKKLLVLLFIFSAWQGFSQITNNSNCEIKVTFHCYSTACVEVCKEVVCVLPNGGTAPFPTKCDACNEWEYVTVCAASACITCGQPTDTCHDLALDNCSGTWPMSFASAPMPGCMAPCATMSGTSTNTSITINN